MKKFLIATLISLTIGSAMGQSLEPLAPTTTLTKMEPTIQTPTSFLYLDDLAQWAQLATSLRQTDHANITLIVSGIGGYIEHLSRFVSAIEDYQKRGGTLTIRVPYQAISANAFLVCAADKVDVVNGGSLMFHRIRGYTSAFFNQIPITVEITSVAGLAFQEKMFNKCIKKEILTQQDVNEIKAGSMVMYSNVEGIILRQTANEHTQDRLELIYDVASLVATITGLLLLIELITKLITRAVRRTK